MTLFHKYYSRKLFFAADVLAALHGAGKTGVEEKELQALALRYGIQNPLCSELLRLLRDAALLTWDRGSRKYYEEERHVPQFPLSAIEESYLQQILAMPQAELFLPPALAERLRTSTPPAWDENIIQTLDAAGQPGNPNLTQREFCLLLEAIARSCAVSYRFCAKNATEARKGCAVPWRLEYSAYDNRWWIILYDHEAGRCVKAWLPNLSEIRLEPQITVSEEEILQARREALMPEPVVLRVKPAETPQKTRNAMDRCFLVLERKEFESSQLHSDGSATVSFRYYRYEENELLRQLLYLGPGIQLLAPQSLRTALLELVNQALERFGKA